MQPYDMGRVQSKETASKLRRYNKSREKRHKQMTCICCANDVLTGSLLTAMRDSEDIAITNLFEQAFVPDRFYARAYVKLYCMDCDRLITIRLTRRLER